MSTSNNVKGLISKLNSSTKSALEGAAGLCVSQTHYDVDLEHLLKKLLEDTNSSLHAILRYFEINPDKVDQQLDQALKGFKTGNTRSPALSPRLIDALEMAWLFGSVDYQTGAIQSGHLIVACLSNRNLLDLVNSSVPCLKDIDVDVLRKNFVEITSKSEESQMAATQTPSNPNHPQTANGTAIDAVKKGGALDSYTQNLTQKARDGKIDAIIGRDDEVRQMVDILSRRRQNNPILTGEAGVGKTAVVEGLARRIALGDVPALLKNVEILTLDLGLLQAGASVKGEFENRLKDVLDEVKQSPKPIILFIDEAHTLIGAGGQAGQNDAANLLKPSLARGELRTIAATTWSEYKKYFERDAALARRFQVVHIEEPDENKAMAMMRAIAPSFEKHHNVGISEDAIQNVVRLSARFLTGRQLPDKAVSVLDTACARVAMSRATQPAAIEDAQKQVEHLTNEKELLLREEKSGASHQKRLTEIDELLENHQSEIAALEEKWQAELQLVDKIAELRAQLHGEEELNAALREDMMRLLADLEELQGEEGLVHPEVTSQVVAGVISTWTGIPLGRVVRDEVTTMRNLEDILSNRVIGQDHALKTIAQRVRTSRVNLEDPNRPKGVFMLVGPSGVGKTETALTIAETLYGGEDNIITINMSEFQEAHTVSTLKGSPPGYVGYGEGGVLTEAVRRKPYSVVLLDEIEKAHPDVLELFFQVFDKGVLEDGEGRRIDFKNTLIILTTNIGTETIMNLTADLAPDEHPSSEMLLEHLREELRHAFKPAFVGRTIPIPYVPIRGQMLNDIVELKFNKITKRIRSNYDAEVSYDKALIGHIADACTDIDSGARNIDNYLTGTILPDISSAILEKMGQAEEFTEVNFSLVDNKMISTLT